MESPENTTTAPEESAINLTAIQTKLDALNDMPAATPEPEVTPSEDVPDIPENSVEGEPDAVEALVEAVVEVPKPEAVSEPEPEVTSTPSAISDAHRRSAVAKGWTDEQIDEALTVNPEAAGRMFEQLHTSRIAEINSYADRGRLIQQQVAAPEPKVSVPTTTPAIAALDVDTLAEKYGNEEMLAEIVGPINAVIASLQPLIQTAEQTRKTSEQDQIRALETKVDEFFSDKKMEPYAEFYGTGDWASLSGDQRKQREAVLVTADALATGAWAQGRNVSQADALLWAHDAQTSHLQTKTIRDNLRKSLEKRDASITMKPSSRGDGPTDGRPLTKERIEQQAAERLKKLFRS